MAEVCAKSEIINELITANNNSTPWVVPWAFCVHAFAIQKWAKIMNRLFNSNEWAVCNQILQIGSKRFDMRLIIVSQKTKNQLNFLADSITYSQFSFPWEENPTLFIKVESFKIMEEFIRRHNIGPYILNIEEMVGISANDEIIKVVSFHPSVNTKLDVISEFLRTYIGLIQSNYSYFYFMMVALPWQQPYRDSEVPVNDIVYSVLPIILKQLGTLNYTNDLNIIDLISLRWALSDVVRDFFHPNLVKHEIDFLVKRELAKIVKNNHLDLKQYLIDTNSKPFNILVYYLVYEFQNFFDTVSFDVVKYNYHFDKSLELNDTILLAEENNVLSKLNSRSNVVYNIDGTGFDRMSLSLFLGLVKCKNVSKITLDINYRWLYNAPKPNRSMSNSKEHSIKVHLIGKNTYNFIEDFITELNTITFNYSDIHLVINCKLNDFRILNNLTDSRITFEKIHIDGKMLYNLYQCDIKPLISLTGCSFENTIRNWELLNSLMKLAEVNIYEDEGTWETLFQFASDEMLKLKTKEFQFNSYTNITIETIGSSIRLNDIKFTVDEYNSKLEIRETTSNNIVELYFLKFSIKPDEKSDYGFYQ